MLFIPQSLLFLIPMRLVRGLHLFYCIFLILSLFSTVKGYAQNDIEPQKRQFRGMWIATVNNLDWPSKPNMSVWRMKREFVKHLNLAQELGMNAVIVQVRPMSDAFYPSELEPWSQFLSGKQGESPPRDFDPMQFMVEETHQRAMEFHAWFNPYRVMRNMDRAHISPDHVYFQHPDWFVTYANTAFFDPGVKPARKFLERVVADVVTKYDIDAIHFDDYFYPGKLEAFDFPDSLSFKKYGTEFTEETKDDWRRENVNLLVKELYDTINYLKPWVHFGISPFGVWRNKDQDAEGSATWVTQTDYDDLYADVRAWCREGWMDYVLPQSYHSLGMEIMDYAEVANWWGKNHGSVNYYIGQAPFRLGTTNAGQAWSQGNEIDRQLTFNSTVRGLQGSAFFRAEMFKKNPYGLNDTLKSKFYKYAALPPISHDDRNRTFEANLVITHFDNRRNNIELEWTSDKPDEIMYYVVYASGNTSDPKNILAITSDTSIKIKKEHLEGDEIPIYIRAVDKYRVESMALIVYAELN